MSRQVFVFKQQTEAVERIARYLIEWGTNPDNEGKGYGGATGRSPVGVWNSVWNLLDKEYANQREAFLRHEVCFLDEYLGAMPSYYQWAWRNLRVDHGGFSSDKVFVPRGCFFEHDRVVSPGRLEEILTEWPDEWTAAGLPGEDRRPPEVRIHKDAQHPVLTQIRQSLVDYDQVVRSHDQRLQLLGLGVGGMIATHPEAGGHIGFVEAGAASATAAETTGDPSGSVMLTRLAPSTLAANETDFQLRNDDGAVTVEPSHMAITQGCGTILSAGEILMMAWGESKQAALERTLLGQPNPLNPAAHLQLHDNVTIYVDEAAFGQLSIKDVSDAGWTVSTAGQRAATSSS